MLRPRLSRRSVFVFVAVVLFVSLAAEGRLLAAIRAWVLATPAPIALGIATSIEDPSGHALDRFHAALDRAEHGEGRARVVWWGASHTAPDRYVGVVRRSLQARFGDAGPGFVSPVRPFAGYDTSGARISWHGAWRTLRGDRMEIGDEYGFAGFAIESLMQGASGVVDTRGGRWGARSIDCIEVAFLHQPNGGRFEVRVDERPIAVVDTHGEVVAGHARYEVRDAPHRIELRAVDDAPVRIFGVALDRNRSGVVIDTAGIPGSRARAHLRFGEQTYRSELRRRDPDLFVLAYGTNESEDTTVPLRRYESELTRVVHRIQQIVPAASCLLVGPSDRPLARPDGTWAPRPLVGGVIDVQRRVAAATGCGFFDVRAFMGGEQSMLAWVDHTPPFAQRDHVHLTEAGHARLGEVMTEALLVGYAP